MKKSIKLIASTLGILVAAGMFFCSCGHEEEQPGPPPEPQKVAVTGVTLSSSSLTLTEGEKATLTYTISPSNATVQNVVWKSSDGTVATIDVSGTVVAVKAGTTTITVTTADGGKTASCTVTVKAKETAVKVTGVTMDDDSKTVTLEVGGTATLKVSVQPENATEKGVSFKSSDETVATVSAEGVVKAVGEGTATITVTTKDGEKTATAEITVIPATVAVTGITMDDDSKEVILEAGETAVLNVTVTPEDATDKTLEWTSSDDKVATVDAAGKVTALKPGEAIITAKTADGGKTATAKITVKEGVSVTGVTLNNTQMSIPAGETYTFEPEFFPKDATNRGVTWKSSDESVATIAADGTMTALKIGTTTITVTTDDGGKKAQCYVTVTAALTDVSGVELSMSSLDLLVGDVFELEAKVKPSTAINQNVTWKSSDETVATVAEDGTIKALKKGSTTITCTTEEGGFKATCTVTVENPGDYIVYYGNKEAPTQITYTLGTVSRDYLQFSLYDKTTNQRLTGIYGDDLKITSSKESVAKSTAFNDSYKIVKAYYQGTTVLTFSYKGIKIKTIQLTVRPKPEYIVMVGDDYLYETTTLLLTVGENTTFLPYDKVNKETAYLPSGLTIESSDPGVARVEIATLRRASGIYTAWKITGVKAGKATVKMSVGSLTRTITVIVGDFVVHYNGIITPSNIEYKLGSHTQDYLKFRLYNKSSNSYVNAAYWNVSSSDTSVAASVSYTEFDKSVQAKKAGTTTLSVKSRYTSKVYGTVNLKVTN